MRRPGVPADEVVVAWLRANNASGTGADGTKVLTGDDQGQLCAAEGAATVGGVGMLNLPDGGV